MVLNIWAWLTFKFFQAKSSRSIVRGNVMFNMVSFLGLERFAYSVFFSFSSREEKEEGDRDRERDH